MIVFFVSNSTGSSIKKARRVLDAFGERIGQDSWSCVVTEKGLTSIEKLLRLEASRNFSVTAHRVRGHRKIEVWTVGSRKNMIRDGIIPIHFSKKENLIKSDIKKRGNILKYIANTKGQTL